MTDDTQYTIRCDTLDAAKVATKDTLMRETKRMTIDQIWAVTWGLTGSMAGNRTGDATLDAIGETLHG